MSPKERVLTSLNWKEPDRVPVQIYMVPEIEEELKKFFAGKDPLEVFEIDFRYVYPQKKPEHLRAPKPKGAERFDLNSATITITTPQGATYTEYVKFPMAEIKTMSDLDDWPWDNPDDYDYSSIKESCKKVKDYAILTGGPGIPDILNDLSRLRGMEQVMIDIATRDEVGLAIIDRFVSIKYEIMKRTLEAADGLIDILWLGEDTGNQNGRMFSEKDFNEVFRPYLQKFIDLGHSFGAKTMMHSCGDTHEIMPTFIEMGLDVLDAMQPEPKGMQPIEKWRQLCYGKLAFCGLISTQSTLPFKSVQECRAEARHRLDVIAKGGGYIFAPSHNIQVGTPIENIIAVYEEALGHKIA